MIFFAKFKLQNQWQSVFSGADTLSLIKHVVKKVASAGAAFFVPKLLQVLEQHQNGLDEAHGEHEPFVIVQDVTPSRARGSRHTNCRAQYITRLKNSQKKFSRSGFALSGLIYERANELHGF